MMIGPRIAQIAQQTFPQGVGSGMQPAGGGKLGMLTKALSMRGAGPAGVVAPPMAPPPGAPQGAPQGAAPGGMGGAMGKLMMGGPPQGMPLAPSPGKFGGLLQGALGALPQMPPPQGNPQILQALGMGGGAPGGQPGQVGSFEKLLQMLKGGGLGAAGMTPAAMTPEKTNEPSK